MQDKMEQQTKTKGTCKKDIYEIVKEVLGSERRNFNNTVFIIHFHFYCIWCYSNICNMFITYTRLDRCFNNICFINNLHNFT